MAGEQKTPTTKIKKRINSSTGVEQTGKQD